MPGFLTIRYFEISPISVMKPVEMYVAKEDFNRKSQIGADCSSPGCVGFTDLGGEDRVKSAKHSLRKLTLCSKVVGVDRSAL